MRPRTRWRGATSRRRSRCAPALRDALLAADITRNIAGERRPGECRRRAADQLLRRPGPRRRADPPLPRGDRRRRARSVAAGPRHRRYRRDDACARIVRAERSCRASARFERSTIETGVAFREGFVEADGFRIRYHGGGRGDAAGASARRRRHAPDAGARPAEPALPGDRVRDAGLRPVAGEHPDADDRANSAPRWRRRSSALGIDRFNLMGTSFGGKVGAVAGGAAAGTGAGAGAGSAGGDPPGRDRAAVRHAGGDGAPALRPSRAARPVAGGRSGGRRQSSARWSGACAGPTATRSSKRGCAAWRRRHWCCSARSTG